MLHNTKGIINQQPQMPIAYIIEMFGIIRVYKNFYFIYPNKKN